MFCRRAPLLFAVVVALTPLAVTGCKSEENEAAKERLSKPEPPDPLIGRSQEVIPSGELADDRAVRDRVNRMTFAEVARRLGSLKLVTQGDLSFERSDLKVKSGEDVSIVQSETGDFSVSTTTSDGSTQELVFANGVLFLKNNNGKWRASRDPVGERNELREDGAGIWRSFYDLFAHALTLEARGTTTHKGRTAVRYALHVPNEEAAARSLASAAKGPPRVEGDEDDGGVPDAGPVVSEREMQAWVSERVRTWRKKAKPGGGEGELLVDQETGALLKVSFDGRLVVGDQQPPAVLRVKLRHEVSAVGKQHEIVVPKDAIEEVVRKKWPVKPRAFLEQEGLVAPLPKEGAEGAAPSGGGAEPEAADAP